MACHRSCHHPHTHGPCCCCAASRCCSDYTTTTAAADPLIQAIAAHILQSPPAAPQPTYHYQYPKTQYGPHQHHHHQQQQHKYQPAPPPPPQDQGLVQSLLRRIAALESTLPHLSPPPAPSATGPPPRNRRPSPPLLPATRRPSIRDVAARTIQSRFRLYLVRRSQTLRQLKHLAAIRSHVAAVKSSLSDEVHMNPKALSQKATDLLLQLDSIQSTDPMVREGKRSISCELVHLLEFADEVSAERRGEMYTESMDRAAFAEESSTRVEELAGVSPVFGEDDEESDTGSPKAPTFTSKTVKRIGFAENGKDSRVSSASGAPFAEEEVTGGRVSEEHWRRPVADPSRREDGRLVGFPRAPEHVAEARWEGAGGGEASLQTIDDEKSPGGRRNAGIRSGTNGRARGSHLAGLSAPLPVQMEPRRGDSRKKNAV